MVAIRCLVLYLCMFRIEMGMEGREGSDGLRIQNRPVESGHNSSDYMQCSGVQMENQASHQSQSQPNTDGECKKYFNINFTNY